jgi:hypothetical protein
MAGPDTAMSGQTPSVQVLWSTREWADAIAALPVTGPLPCRTVLVPRGRVAHALRRELIRAGHADILAGTRFVPLAAAAAAVLRAGGVAFHPGEDALRPARLRTLLARDLPLQYLDLNLLRTTLGWDEAFARTIGDLEGAGLGPADIDASGNSRRLRDVAAIWRALDESAGRSWTTQRIYAEAAAALEADPNLWPFHGAVLACAGSNVTVTRARFLRAVPCAALALLGARPARERYLDRVAALLGEAAGEALRSSRAPRSAGSERNLLASFLFEPPPVLADESRPRSEGPDGTVDLEEHAGVEAEIEATADWVVRQAAAGSALEDIAVLLPTLDPLAALVAERLARLPWECGALPVHVAGGLPLVGSAAGARALAVVRALRAHLAAGELAEVLPAVRPSAPDGRHLSHGAATDLVWSLGTVGGNSARPAGALEWSTRAAERDAELEADLADARAAEEAGGGSGRRARDIERLLADLRAIRPALDALVALARNVLGGAGLGVLWPALCGFFEEWLLQPGDGPRVQVLLEERLGALASDAACGTLAGDDALRVIEDAVASTRVTCGGFGDPAVYVGAVRAAVGLQFRAVRVIGLSEGHFPSVSREDPVVPDVVREGLRAGAAGATPPTAADRALEDLHALDAAVRNAAERIALSSARLDIERSQREPSSVILEAAAALDRPNRVTHERDATIPDMASLRRDGFAPAREAAAAFRLARPLGEAAWQDGVSRRALGMPPRWCGLRSLDLDRVARLATSDACGPMDGLLGPGGAVLQVPGLTAEHPISPSAMETLLGCPHAFLLGNVLGFDEPACAPPQREIGQPYYGNLFHTVAADFYERHGTAFCAREGALPDWLARADEVVECAFAAFLRQYPLVGEAVRAQQRERLRGDLRELLEYDWRTAAAGRRFVAAERSFGRTAGVELPLGERTIFVRGRIDRLDVEKGKTLVRDLKTGRAYRRVGRDADPAPALDLQIGVYGLVAQALAEQWKTPKRVAAAYTYVGRGGTAERCFRNDFHNVLEPEARRWLGVAAGLLAGRFFPRTPNAADCTYCCFRPVCGDGAHGRAANLLADARGMLAEFAALKGAAPADDEDD